VGQVSNSTCTTQSYCQRGEAENRIKEAQIGLFATRTSCRWPIALQTRAITYSGATLKDAG
jgi:Transposase DDE domain group 1